MLIAECARSKRQRARKNKLRVDVEARHDPLKPTHARIALAAPSQKSNEAGAGRRQRAQEIAEIVGQRASPPTPARANQRLVSDEPGEADQDRCEGGCHGPLCCLSEGGGRHPRQVFQEILRLIAELRPQAPPAPA
jgi:hypothetical protein